MDADWASLRPWGSVCVRDQTIKMDDSSLHMLQEYSFFTITCAHWLTILWKETGTCKLHFLISTATCKRRFVCKTLNKLTNTNYSNNPAPPEKILYEPIKIEDTRSNEEYCENYFPPYSGMNYFWQQRIKFLSTYAQGMHAETAPDFCLNGCASDHNLLSRREAGSGCDVERDNSAKHSNDGS